MNRKSNKTSLEVTPDHIYYNIAVQNDQKEPIDLQFQDIRTVAIVKNPEEYYLAVVRFFVPGAGIPLFQVDFMELDDITISSNTTLISQGLFTEGMIGLTISGIGIMPGTTITTFNSANNVTISQATTFSGTTNITFPGVTNNAVSLVFGGSTYTSYVPFTQTSDFDVISVNSYQAFLDMVNNALASAYQKMLADASPLPTTQYPPKFYWDSTTWLISLYIDSAYAVVDQPEIYMNFNLFSYFQGFKNYQFGYGLSTLLDNKFLIDDSDLVIPNIGSNLTNANNYQLPLSVAQSGLTGANYLKVTQEYTSFHVWPSIESILFTSSLAPIKKEFVPNSGQVGTEAQASNNTLPVISDFIVPTDISPGIAKGNLEYLPTAEYRMIDFISNVGFNELNIKAFWQDNFSRLFPIKLEPNDFASIKFLFRKKDFKGK